MVGVVIGLIAIAIIVYFSRKAVVLRNLRQADKKTIASFADGDKGKISGKIVFSGQILTAPLSGKKCVYYYILVERRDGKNWKKLFEEEKKADVVVTDGTGFAIIDTRFTMSYLVPDTSLDSGTFEDPTPKLKNYLSGINIDTQGLFGLNKTLRVIEGVLEENEDCTVSGTGQWNLSADHKIRIPSNKILVMTVSDPENEKVYITDDPEAKETA
jgi:hypothetical protein